MQKAMNMATDYLPVKQQISPVDALWSLIQSQKKSVRRALMKRMIEDDAEIMNAEYQKRQIHHSLKQGWKEVQEAMVTGHSLKSADELLHELEQIK